MFNIVFKRVLSAKRSILFVLKCFVYFKEIRFLGISLDLKFYIHLVFSQEIFFDQNTLFSILELIFYPLYRIIVFVEKEIEFVVFLDHLL